MESWFGYALVSALAFGFMQAFAKVPSSRSHDKYAYLLFGSIVSTVACFVVFHASIGFDLRTALLGLVWGTGYAVITIWQSCSTKGWLRPR